jgi:gas vesicle protein
MKFTSFVIGMGAGAAIALLFAPRSGDETREMLSEKMREGSRIAGKRAKEFRDLAGDKAAQLRDIANDTAAQVRDIASDAAARGKDALTRQKEAVTAAVQAGKDTYNREAQKIS